MRLERGTVCLVALDPTVGHEQKGVRPCVVVSAPVVTDHQRFPMIAAVPITATPGEGALYPGLEAGESGLRKPSWAMVDQLRAVDKRRVRTTFGQVSGAELAAIEEGLRLFLGL